MEMELPIPILIPYQPILRVDVSDSSHFVFFKINCHLPSIVSSGKFPFCGTAACPVGRPSFPRHTVLCIFASSRWRACFPAYRSSPLAGGASAVPRRVLLSPPTLPADSGCVQVIDAHSAWHGIFVLSPTVLEGSMKGDDGQLLLQFRFQRFILFFRQLSASAFLQCILYLGARSCHLLLVQERLFLSIILVFLRFKI